MCQDIVQVAYAFIFQTKGCSWRVMCSSARVWGAGICQVVMDHFCSKVFEKKSFPLSQLRASCPGMGLKRLLVMK